jgi:hypothetical protein
MTQKTASKYTPGPWRVGANVPALDGLGIAMEVERDDFTVCLIHPCEEIDSNARLIAKAPEMYGLLLLGQVAIMEGGHNLSPLMHKWLDNARDLKAEIDGE